MLRARATELHGDPDARVSPLLPQWQEGLHPAVRAEAETLVASGALPLHDHVHALHSSQAFALNLFLPARVGDRTALSAFVSDALGRAVSIVDVELEFIGSGDLLAEIPGAVPGPDDRVTQADVALHLQDEAGRRGLLLVEVKLSEGGFTACGGAGSRGNRDRAPCEDAAIFLADPARCYLRRPRHAARDRRYWTLFAAHHGSVAAAFPGAAPTGPCPFAGDWQQPMRNHALALAAVEAGLADFAAVALVHHDHNPDVPGPWDAYREAVAAPELLQRWPASRLLTALDATLPAAPFPVGAWLRERYHLPETP
ncbi:MAG: hypothetical protein H6732_01895 [Alphaproteobacteria bacterium]|nr:hypothetical protein [Alphaproteobacteria bacterium]